MNFLEKIKAKYDCTNEKGKSIDEQFSTQEVFNQVSEELALDNHFSMKPWTTPVEYGYLDMGCEMLLTNLL